jgi:micrococcal nuclease
MRIRKKQPKMIALIGIAVSFVAVGALSSISPPQDSVALPQDEDAISAESQNTESTNIADADEAISVKDEPRDAEIKSESVEIEKVDTPDAGTASAKDDESATIENVATVPQTNEPKIQPESPTTYRVLRVVDGDTIEIEINGTKEKVRFIGVDTPESVHPDASRNVEYGKIASDFTKDRLDGSNVTLELDVQERDRYGRILAYVYLNGTMFNKTLLEEGHAQVAMYPPNVKYVDDFTKLQESARNAKKGIWQYESSLAETESAPTENVPPQTIVSNILSGVTVVSVPDVVHHNEDVTVTIIGKPNTEYRLRVFYKSESTADGLGAKTSDGEGRVSWTWQIGGRTSEGNAYATITEGDGTMRIDFTVKI